ncbi:tetratricopeptide repeat protein, partial [Streptomyces sp. NPDC052299]|uniref:tetratricopeptide repeat protein n=1 Tax=Streptomyces sp. NPDC052299 TaxID=3155054 RepID=UPI003447A071
DTLRARASLAISYSNAGRTTEATTLQEGVLADREQLLGPDHPDTVNARHNLAIFYTDAGRTTEATTLQEGVLADFERL